MLRYVGWRLVFAGALHTASAQPWPARRLIAVTSLGQRSCRKLPGGCGGQAASASAFARATPHAAPFAAPHATPHAPPHGHAKARGAASLAAPARGGNCTGLHIAINSNLRYATQGSNPILAEDPRQVCYSRVRSLPWTQGDGAPLPPHAAAPPQHHPPQWRQQAAIEHGERRPRVSLRHRAVQRRRPDQARPAGSEAAE